MFGGSGMKPSPQFMSRLPRESMVFKTHEMRGPLKPSHGCTLRNPRRAPPESSLEGLAWDAWNSSRGSPPRAAATVEQRFVEERMESLGDGSVIVRPPRVSSAPPAERKAGIYGPPPVENEADFVPPPAYPTCDPWMVRDAILSVWGFRPIDLFRDMLELGETELDLKHFVLGLQTKFPEPYVETKHGKPMPGFGHATKRDLDRTFKWFDKDKSGRIDILEVEKAVRKLKGPRPDPNAVRSSRQLRNSAEDLSKYLGDLKAGAILPRKLAALLAQKRISALELFSSFDGDNSDSVSYDELVDNLGSFGITACKYEVDELFESLDTDHSGSISYDEFRQAMTKATRENDRKGAAERQNDQDDAQRRRKLEDFAQRRRNLTNRKAAAAGDQRPPSPLPPPPAPLLRSGGRSSSPQPSSRSAMPMAAPPDVPTLEMAQLPSSLSDAQGSGSHSARRVAELQMRMEVAMQEMAHVQQELASIKGDVRQTV